MQQRTQGALLVMLAALCWGVAGGMGGLLIDKGWHPLVASFYRGAVGLLFVLVWLALHPQGSGLGNPRLWLWSGLAGLGVAGNFSFYFLSIEAGSLPVAATLMYSAPVFVYLVSFGLGLEKPTLLKGAAIALVLTGIVLLTGLYRAGPGGMTGLGIAAGLLAGLSYSLFIFGFKYASEVGSPPASLAIAFAVLVVVLSLPAGPAQALAVLDSPDWPLFTVLGLLGGGISFAFYVRGLAPTAPTVASILAMVEPVTASLFGVVVLGAHLESPQLLGMALVLVTVTALSIHSSRQPAS
ncbi:MAG: DMT family transporter [Marinobacter sp.]